MKIPFKINQREKRVIMIGGIIAVCIVLYNLFAWYSGTKNNAHDFIEAKRLTLEKQIQKISEKKIIQNRFDVLSKDMEILERGLLKGDKPPVVAAQIQSILKQMASSIGIDITLEKALTPEDRGSYLRIPVEIGFTTQTEKLKKMLYKIRTAKFVFTISEMKIMVKNTRNPVDSYSTLVVNGFIKKSKPPEQDKGEEKSAS